MRKWVGRVLVCGSFAVSIILTFYSAKYSFNNPDPQAYYVEGTDETEPQLVPTADVNVDGVVPIHGLYDLWFKIMFASMVLFYFVFFGIIFCYNKGYQRMVQYTTVGFTSYCTIVFIMGMLFRFGEAGKFASSDAADMSESSALLRQE